MLPAATGFANARRCPRRRAKRAFSSACNRSALTPTRTPPSTGANGTRPDFIRRSSSRLRTSKRRSRSYKRRTCAPRRRGRPRSAIIFAFPNSTSSISTAPAAPPGGRPRSPSGATIGARWPTRTPASCGRWACGRATRSASPRSSLSTSEAGALLPAPSGSAPAAFPSAPALPACRRGARSGSIW